MKRKIGAMLVLAVAIQQAALAQVPQIINYQGRLLNGTNLVNGNVGIALRLYNQSAGGSPLYEDSNSVAVVDGLYSTFIGDHPFGNAFLTAMTNPAVYVEVAVNGIALSPRERLSSVAYSLNTRGLSVDMANNVVLNPAGNSVGTTAVGITIGGGTGNLLAAGDLGVIAGGMSNRIGYQGLFDSTYSPYSVIGGGRMNSSDARETVIGGGTGNQIIEGFLSDASRTVIGGGETNTADSSGGSVIAGGVGNRLDSSAGSVIGGGVGNSIGEFSVSAAIGGGQYNEIGFYSDYATIAGGIGNRLERENDFGTISGGNGNRIGSNTQYAVISGGQSNRIESGAEFASIGGGNGAVASVYGQRAYSSGTYTNNSIILAQSSEFILRGETVGAVTNVLFLDGVSKRLTIKPKQTLVFDITVAARNTGTFNAGYQVHAMAERSGSSVYVNGSTIVPVDVPPIFEDVTGWKVQLKANSALSAVDVEVIGAASTTIRWVAVIRATDIQVP